MRTIFRGRAATTQTSWLTLVAALGLSVSANAHAQQTSTARPATTPSAAVAPTKGANKSPDDTVEVIVTGVMHKTRVDQAAVAETTVTEKRMKQLMPISTADILSEVPGVVVVTDAGETRNTVYTRGMAFGTGANTVGYYWTTMMEDGLPVTANTFSNFNPDNFLRSDLNTRRVEAVRGGSAAVTGPNAPGGDFNYISKDGYSAQGGEIQIRGGIEGNNLPYWRTDGYYGWESKDGKWAASIGGFYRRDTGYRYMPYPLNSGGQLKATLSHKYDTTWGSGTLTLRVKDLDDQNGTLDAFKPLAHGWNNPVYDTGFNQDANFYPIYTGADQISLGNGQSVTFNPSSQYHNFVHSIQLQWDHDFHNGWTLTNNLRFQHDQEKINEVDTIGYLSLTNATVYTNLGTALDGISSRPGTYNFYMNGTLAASVNRTTTGSNIFGTNVVTGTACGSNTYCATYDGLPGSNITSNSPVNANNMVMQATADYANYATKDFIDNFVASKQTDHFTFTGGFYYSDAKQSRMLMSAGRAVMPLENYPSLLQVTFTDKATGKVYQLTDLTGFGGRGVSDVFDRPHYTEFSPFAGFTWKPDSHWLFDTGVRYSTVTLKTENVRWVVNPNASNLAFGGVDGNPLTVYDNVYYAYSSASDFTATRNVHFWQFTGAVNYTFDSHNGMYARYTHGVKGIDGKATQFDSTFAAQNLNIGILPQIQQWETGFTHKDRIFSFNPVLFYVDLNNISVQSQGFETDGITRYYTPSAYSHLRTYGLEMFASAHPLRWLTATENLTLQNGQSISLATWNLGANGPSDDFVTYTGGLVALEPKVVANTSLNFTFGDFNGYVRDRYIGRRPVTNLHTSWLPANVLWDTGIAYTGIKDTTMSLNINNLFNNRNVTAISNPAPNLPSGMTLDQYISQYPNSLVQIQTNAPRSIFLTVDHSF